MKRSVRGGVQGRQKLTQSCSVIREQPHVRMPQFALSAALSAGSNPDSGRGLDAFRSNACTVRTRRRGAETWLQAKQWVRVDHAARATSGHRHSCRQKLGCPSLQPGAAETRDCWQRQQPWPDHDGSSNCLRTLACYCDQTCYSFSIEAESVRSSDPSRHGGTLPRPRCCAAPPPRPPTQGPAQAPAVGTFTDVRTSNS
jgi:hypothetical protein